jgi:hypothetical protein
MFATGMESTEPAADVRLSADRTLMLEQRFAPGVVAAGLKICSSGVIWSAPSRPSRISTGRCVAISISTVL